MLFISFIANFVTEIVTWMFNLILHNVHVHCINDIKGNLLISLRSMHGPPSREVASLHVPGYLLKGKMTHLLTHAMNIGLRL